MCWVSLRLAGAIPRALPEEITRLLDVRQTARQTKNWAESDRLRDELARMGWEVRDGKDGQKVKKL